MKLRPEVSDVRIDKYLCGAIGSYSRGYFQRLIKDGLVTVNGKPSRPITP
jgi:S4 domain.